VECGGAVGGVVIDGSIRRLSRYYPEARRCDDAGSELVSHCSEVVMAQSRSYYSSESELLGHSLGVVMAKSRSCNSPVSKLLWLRR
jgi:hypothetical protein